MLKNKTIPIIFLFLISLLLFVFQFFSHNKSVLKIYKPLFNNFEVLIELNTENSSIKPILNINGEAREFLKVRNMLFFDTNIPIKNIEILSKNDSEVKSVFFYNGIKPKYYKDFSSFEKSKTKVCKNNVCEIYTNYKIPNNMFSSQSLINYNSNFNTFCVFLLSLFSGHFWYLISYLVFSIALFLCFKYKHIKIKELYVFVFIFILGVVLRLNGFFDTLLMYDDYYTLDLSNPNASFSMIFKDPGNPWFLYFLYKIYFLILPFNIYFAKGLALFISCLFLYFSWNIAKKEFNTKIANMFLFLISINIHFVFRALEIRSYVLQAFLTVLLVYFLFKIINTNKTKYFVFYFFFATIAFNLHYFEILFLFANLIFATVVLLKNHENKKLLYFIVLHLIPLLIFMPYFLKVALNKGLLDETFNQWIKPVGFEMAKSSLYFVFGGFISFVLYVFYFVKNCLNENYKYKLFSIYSFYSIFCVLILSILISQYKPILTERYMIFLLPLVLINICLFFQSNKKHIVIFFIWILLIQNYATVKKNNKNKGLDLIPFNISNQYKDQNKNKNVYAIVRNFTYTKDTKKFNFIETRNDVNYKIIDTKKTSIKDFTDEILKNDKNAVIFTLLFEMNKENLNKYTCYFNIEQDMCLWKIEAPIK